MYLQSMLQCPTCSFTAPFSRYDKTKDLNRERVERALQALNSPAMFKKYDAAIIVETNWTNNKQSLARLSLG